MIDEASAKLGEKGRIFVRYSGTESLVRVMAEGPDLKEIRTLTKKIAAAFSEEIGEDE
jgi:phosphoglucosamine mutase